VLLHCCLQNFSDVAASTSGHTGSDVGFGRGDTDDVSSTADPSDLGSCVGESAEGRLLCLILLNRTIKSSIVISCTCMQDNFDSRHSGTISVSCLSSDGTVHLRGVLLIKRYEDECVSPVCFLGEAARAAMARAASLGRAAAEVGNSDDSHFWCSQRKHFFVLTNSGNILPRLMSW
jgi:hypothetical protein